MNCSMPASLSITNSQSLLKFMSIESVMPSSHLMLCCPLLLPASIFPASGSFPVSQFFASGGQNIGVSASTSVLLMNTQDWSHLGWTDWISLKSKGLFKSLLKHHSSKTSILQCLAFFIVQLAHPYMTTGKTIALTRWTFVDKVMSLLFNMLSAAAAAVTSVVSNSVWPHRQQPTRLPHPWDSPGKNTGVGCHFLLQLCCLGLS